MHIPEPWLCIAVGEVIVLVGANDEKGGGPEMLIPWLCIALGEVIVIAGVNDEKSCGPGVWGP